MNTNYGSRKFIVAIVALALGAFMRFRGVMTDESTLTLMLAAVLGYPAGNVAQKWLTQPADK
jgi:hypothetical protein